jgi:hypothetical protein
MAGLSSPLSSSIATRTPPSMRCQRLRLLEGGGRVIACLRCAYGSHFATPAGASKRALCTRSSSLHRDRQTSAYQADSGVYGELSAFVRSRA